MGVDGSGLNAEVVLLEVSWNVLTKHVVGLVLSFLGGAILIGFLHCRSCLSHCTEDREGLRESRVEEWKVWLDIKRNKKTVMLQSNGAEWRAKECGVKRKLKALVEKEESG